MLREHEFTSGVPLVGRLIAAFRRRWNNVSTRWYVSPVMRQQSEFNQLTIEQFAQLMVRLNRQAEQLSALAGLAEKLDHLQQWLIVQDREQTELRHDLGEIELLVRQLLHAQPGEAPSSQQLDQGQPTDAPV